MSCVNAAVVYLDTGEGNNRVELPGAKALKGKGRHPALLKVNMKLHVHDLLLALAKLGKSEEVIAPRTPQSLLSTTLLDHPGLTCNSQGGRDVAACKPCSRD